MEDMHPLQPTNSQEFYPANLHTQNDHSNLDLLAPVSSEPFIDQMNQQQQLYLADYSQYSMQGELLGGQPLTTHTSSHIQTPPATSLHQSHNPSPPRVHIVPSPARSRANTVNSPPSLQSVPEIKSETELVNASEILQRIAKDAASGSQACLEHKGNEVNNLIGHIANGVARVQSILQSISDMSIHDRNTMDDFLHPQDYFSSSDQVDEGRKRCASPLVDSPARKAPKTEPQEAAISPPSTRSSSPLAQTFVFNPTKPMHSPQSFAPQPNVAMNMTPAPSSVLLRSSPPCMPSTQNFADPVAPRFSRAGWSEPIIPTRQHSHSLSAGSILATDPSTPMTSYSTAPSPAASVNGVTVLGRMNRSGSVGGGFSPSFNFTFGKPEVRAHSQTWSHLPSQPASPATWPESVSGSGFHFGGDDDYEEDTEESDHGVSSSSNHIPASSDIPPEYYADVDRIFFEYLNKICSNLDATDFKGEAIHQTLMPKKMQRLDESKDFRPFKFRIAAFTNAFVEELARQGFPEEKIPTKKVRHYLWRQQYILRYNEDGKKAKSKGNHIWNIEAKKTGDGKWEFSPFHRKLAGTPSGVAYVGHRWSWTPRVWDPQASWQNVPVKYSSPQAPSWLSWKDDTLQGIPPSDAKSCDVTVVAQFTIDGLEGQLSQTVRIEVLPSATSERHPISPEAAVMQQRSVAEESVVSAVLKHAAHSTEVVTPPPYALVPQISTQALDLAKQKQVLDQSSQAFDHAIMGSTQNRELAYAAKGVVAAAAQSVVPTTNGAPLLEANFDQVSDVTKDAIASAIKIVGTQSNNVNIVVTATDLLNQQSMISQQSAAQSLLTGMPPRGMPLSYPTAFQIPEYV